METISVGIGELKVSRNACVLESISLGSCVGIALFDPVTKTAGLAHIMLPDSSQSSRTSHTAMSKFADVAVREMLGEMQKAGALKNHIVAKIAGGACMFQSVMNDPSMNIGERNVAAVRQLLARENIVIIAEDTGKNYGRTVQLDTALGKFTIKSAKYGIKEL